MNHNCKTSIILCFLCLGCSPQILRSLGEAGVISAIPAIPLAKIFMSRAGNQVYVENRTEEPIQATILVSVPEYSPFVSIKNSNPPDQISVIFDPLTGDVASFRTFNKSDLETIENFKESSLSLVPSKTVFVGASSLILPGKNWTINWNNFDQHSQPQLLRLYKIKIMASDLSTEKLKKVWTLEKVREESWKLDNIKQLFPEFEFHFQVGVLLASNNPDEKSTQKVVLGFDLFSTWVAEEWRRKYGDRFSLVEDSILALYCFAMSEVFVHEAVPQVERQNK